jgi:hypothetical protein
MRGGAELWQHPMGLLKDVVSFSANGIFFAFWPWGNNIMKV